jgi:hypothetical protein
VPAVRAYQRGQPHHSGDVPLRLLRPHRARRHGGSHQRSTGRAGPSRRQPGLARSPRPQPGEESHRWESSRPGTVRRPTRPPGHPARWRPGSRDPGGSRSGRGRPGRQVDGVDSPPRRGRPPVAAPLTPRQWPRAIPLLEVGASAPMVVPWPCPVRTVVSGGRVSGRSPIERTMVGKSEKDPL